MQNHSGQDFKNANNLCTAKEMLLFLLLEHQY